VDNAPAGTYVVFSTFFTSHSTSTPSAFEVFFTANALYKLLTCLLTYLHLAVCGREPVGGPINH